MQKAFLSGDQDGSTRADQNSHRQAVTSQQMQHQPQQGSNPKPSRKAAQPNLLHQHQGSRLAATNGQSTADTSDSEVNGLNGLTAAGSGPQRTASGKMLNPFASTFIPRTSSESLLSTLATSSQ